MSNLSKSVGKKFVITGEIDPPRGPDLKEFNQKIQVYKKARKKIAAINVVDVPGGVLLMSSLGASLLLKDAGVEPVYQVTCRDRNVFAIESDLIAASAHGLENVLALTGDHPKCRTSEHPNATPVFELDSTTLLILIKEMNEGRDITGKALNKNTGFFPGAAVNPGVNPIEPEILKLKRKMDSGARFFQSQVIFEPKVMEDFLTKLDSMLGDVRKKILMGVCPLYSYGMYKFLKDMPGVVISEETGKRIRDAENRVEEGVNLALEVMDKAKDFGLGGVHLSPAGKVDLVPTLLKDY
jgi:5,10-methylenetetrahydrofolate reductase